MQANKVFDMFEMSQLALRHKQQGEKIVLCHGTFDLMHTGHIRYLQAAKKNGEKLFVTLTADEHVNKGPGRPVFNADLRAENLAALECVDYVAINNKQTAVNVIRLLRPDFYVKGSDYKNTDDDVTGNIKREIEITEKFGGSVVFTDEIVFSSSKLLTLWVRSGTRIIVSSALSLSSSASLCCFLIAISISLAQLRYLQSALASSGFPSTWLRNVF